uniref:Uncharacterized protein n=1 Tax=Meloidogyne floridensis TaxID=298350 RepID=A0A915PB84_9BILA
MLIKIIIYHSENYETDVEQPQINERFILQKLLNFRLETTTEKYAEFLNNMGIMPIPDNTTFDELKNNIDRLQNFAYNDEGIKYMMRHLNRNNHYNVELNKRAIETGEFEEVSIRSYLENYDIFEVKANKFRQIFNQMYPNKKLFSLKLAESTSGIILYTKFLPDTSIEVHPIMKDFWPIIYTNFTGNKQNKLNIFRLLIGHSQILLLITFK